MRARRLRRALGLAAFGLLLAAQVDAQPAPWAPERLTPGWTFTPSMAFGMLRDSNVTLRNQGAPRIAEWVALVNPRGEIDYNGRRTRLNLGYSGAYEAYRELDALNRFDQRARFELRQALSPRTTLRARAAYAVSPTTDRLEIGTVPFVDIGSRAFDTGVSVEARLAPRTTLGGSYGFVTMAFDREDAEGPLRELIGGDAHSPGARLSYAVNGRLTVSGVWSYTRARMSFGRGTFGMQHASGELSYRAAERTTLSAGAGAAHLAVAETGLSLWGPALHAGIEHQIGRASLSARYERLYVPSFGFGGLAANQRVSGGVRVPFASGRSYVSGSVSYSRNSPVEALGVGFNARSLWTAGAVGFHVASWLRTEAFANLMHQTTDVRGEIDRVRIGFQLVTFKPLRMD